MIFSDECLADGIGCDFCDCHCHSMSAPVFLSNADVREYHIGEARATVADSGHGVVDLSLHDSLKYIREYADMQRYLAEVAFNVKVTTMTYYMGLGYHTEEFDLIAINKRYRDKGVIF